MSTQSFSEMQAKVGTLIREILFLTEGTLCIFIIKDQEGFYRIAKSGKLLEDFQPKVTTYYSQAKLLLDFKNLEGKKYRKDICEFHKDKLPKSIKDILETSEDFQIQENYLLISIDQELENSNGYLILGSSASFHLDIRHINRCLEDWKDVLQKVKSAFPELRIEFHQLIKQLDSLDSLDKEKEINDLQEFSLLSSSMNLDILPNPVCIVQENSMRFSFGNLKFFEYFALSEDSYGKCLPEIISDETETVRLQFFEIIQEAFERPDGVAEREVRCVFKNQGLRWVLIICKNLNPGITKSIFFEFIDTTEKRKLLEKSISTEANALASSLQSTFLSLMSHELRTPLNVVLGMAELIHNTSALGSTQKQYLREIQNSGRQLLAIINDLLSYMQIEQGKIQLEQRSFSISKCIDDVIEVLSQQQETKKIQLILDCDLKIPGLVIGDASRLSQILLHLYSNAIKFTDVGEINFLVKLVENPPDKKSEEFVYIRFEITDTGVGIPNEKIHLLFQPFSQVDSSFSRGYGGTGLGLSIAGGILKLMGGEFEKVESEVGKGTKFAFVVPFKVDESQLENNFPKLKGQTKILINISHEGLNQTFRHLFEFFHYQVYTSHKISDAIDILETEKNFSLVFCDFDDVESFELIDFINSSNDLTVDVLSGIVTKKARRTIRSLKEEGQIDGFLVKPMTNAQVAKLLNHLYEFDQKIERSNQMRDTSVLILEKDPFVSNIQKHILQSLGMNVDCLTNEDEAFDLCSKRFYQMAFLSNTLDNMSGFDFAKKLRKFEDNRNPQIILISILENPSKKELLQCINSGIDDFISKPPSRETVIEKLRKFFPQNEYQTHGRKTRSSGHSSTEAIMIPKTKSLPNIQSDRQEKKFGDIMAPIEEKIRKRVPKDLDAKHFFPEEIDNVNSSDFESERRLLGVIESEPDPLSQEDQVLSDKKEKEKEKCGPRPIRKRSIDVLSQQSSSVPSSDVNNSSESFQPRSCHQLNKENLMKLDVPKTSIVNNNPQSIASSSTFEEEIPLTQSTPVKQIFEDSNSEENGRSSISPPTSSPSPSSRSSDSQIKEQTSPSIIQKQEQIEQIEQQKQKQKQKLKQESRNEEKSIKQITDIPLQYQLRFFTLAFLISFIVTNFLIRFQ